MFEFLNKYAISLGIHLNLESVPIQTNLVLFCIDRLLAFHHEHTEIRRLANNSIDNLDLTEPNFSIFRKKVEEMVAKQVWINNHIQTYFAVFILEIAKDLELKEDSIYKDVLNQIIIDKSYKRLKRGKTKNISTMQELVEHFRDALVHNQKEGISDIVRLKEYGISSTRHLPFVVDGKNSTDWCFMIGDGILNFSTLEILFESVLKTGFSKFPYSSPPT